MNLRSSQPAAEVLIVGAGPAGLAAAIAAATKGLHVEITTPCSLPLILFQRLLEVHIDHRACIFPGIDELLASGLHMLTS